MVDDQIDDHVDPSVVAFLDQLVEIVEGAEFGIDLEVILNVVLMIGGGRHHRRQPDAVRAEIVACVRIAVVDVVELFNNAGDIAGHIVVRIVEGADPYLIEAAVFVRRLFGGQRIDRIGNGGFLIVRGLLFRFVLGFAAGGKDACRHQQSE